MPQLLRRFQARVLAFARTAHWLRGARTFVALGSAVAVCHLLGKPPGVAALGVFYALLIDNGGPYRTRLTNMLTVTLGCCATLLIGILVPRPLAVVLPATALICFALTYMRVLGQPMSGSSVLVLVVYFAGLDGAVHTLAGGLSEVAILFVSGCWAMLLSLFLWPIDPFGPARGAIAACYASLAGFTVQLQEAAESFDPKARLQAAHEWQRRQRPLIEAAREALAATGTRAPSRTLLARNLAVLLETSDMLLARTMRLTELADLPEHTQTPATTERFAALLAWLAAAERSIAGALAERPLDGGAALAREGSLRVQFVARPRAAIQQVQQVQDFQHSPNSPAAPLERHLLREERDALLEIEIAFDALYSLWTGFDTSAGRGWIAADPGGPPAHRIPRPALDALRANWNLDAMILRHSLRLAIVGVTDVLVMRAIHVNHGFWLPMTSIILLQPSAAGALRKSLQRVSGTVSGALVAALLAAAVHDSRAITAIIVVCASITVAAYAVDYAVYTFFLTPAFVLLSLPHPGDWLYAGVRVGTTLIGASIALGAMRLLWPERAERELAGLLVRCADAEAGYVRALLAYWATPAAERRLAERTVLAAARRACGLASNDAEEAADRIVQEPRFARLDPQERILREEALTFTTYLRRLTQTITTLALVGRPTAATLRRVTFIGQRLGHISSRSTLPVSAIPSEAEEEAAGPVLVDVAEEQLQRMERQARVLERSAAALMERA